MKLAHRRKYGCYKPRRGYKPQNDYTESASSWNYFTKQWEEPVTQDDATDVQSASSWNCTQQDDAADVQSAYSWNSTHQWLEPVARDDPPDVQEGGDQPPPEPVLEMINSGWRNYSWNPTQQCLALPAQDDVPDVQSPSSGNITQPLPEQEAGDQPSPQHIWTVEDDKPADFYAMD